MKCKIKNFKFHGSICTGNEKRKKKEKKRKKKR